MVSTKSEYYARKQKIFDFVGTKCVICSLSNDLQIDHVDHNAKSFNVLQNWGISWDRLVLELIKCQTLCKKCHLTKSIEEGSLAKGWTNEPRDGIRHGKVHHYNKYKCRCELCCEAARKSRKKYRP